MNKTELRAFRNQAREMDQLQASIDMLRGRIGPKIPSLEGGGIRGSGGGSPTERIVEQLVLLQELYDDKLREYADERLKIEKAIEPLTPDQRAVIRSYYLDGLTWEATAYLLGFSYQHIHRIHASALQKLA